MTGRLFPQLAGAMLLVLGTSAGAVGLGPLVKDGVIDGPRQAFLLTLFNPYEQPTVFVAFPIGGDDEDAQSRVTVFPAEARLASRSTRQIMVIADGLQVGETYAFRVCAQRKSPPEGIAINARVCSKLSAHRVG
jgi:hypothetical protein